MELCPSLSIKVESVKEETVLQMTRMSCLYRHITSAANDIPIVIGGSTDDCGSKLFGTDLRE